MQPDVLLFRKKKNKVNQRQPPINYKPGKQTSERAYSIGKGSIARTGPAGGIWQHPQPRVANRELPSSDLPALSICTLGTPSTKIGQFPSHKDAPHPTYPISEVPPADEAQGRATIGQQATGHADCRLQTAGCRHQAPGTWHLAPGTWQMSGVQGPR
ncbi:hypothetical protein BO70DRAFT_160639 [Aspergillus heteromorphus CBS 117.55]|uniref:Uncharacterized protein n=1 Tax=Aspergillus heteromorphus CBS 117.55 TaxID=1448321 RepID=A0A317WSM2_9EURO|nr:uncharacterized protein BO70DRAFT_160639 [Aspergillus heteromorphus CBS 117.55]PWY89065.1 hypothetical protein BO70DRAFT_160639 [Aspergillus heteromorphus CBS 117.55]